MECFHFSEQRFPRICLNKLPIVSVQHFILSLRDYAILISNDSLTFQSQYLFFMERVLRCNLSKWPWHSFVYSVVPEDDQLPLMLSCWCLIDLLMIFFFVSPLYTDPHEHFNLYIPGWLFRINLSLFLHKIFFKLGPV